MVELLPEADGFLVRPMTRQDLTHAYKWSLEEGWNIGRYDHDAFYATDPAGFFIGELNGEPIGSVSGVAYGESYGFVGIYILRPEYRGKGYGIRIFNAAMEHLAGRCIGLDGVIAQQDNYRRSGFTFEYRNIRYQWKPTSSPRIPDGIVSALDVPFELLAAYDADHFLARRDAFLSRWISLPEASPLVSVTNGRIDGFGMIRRFASGWSIGPLFADTPEIAETLLTSLGSNHPGEDVYLDVPEVNAAALAMAKAHNMSPVFETARMYTGPAPKLPLDEIFGVTTYELG